MRLRQLARKLDVDTEKLIQYLRVSNLPSDGDSNAKLSEEQEKLLLEKFGPVIKEEIEEVKVTPEINSEKEKEEEVATEEKEDTELTEEIVVEKPFETSPSLAAESNEQTELPEVIRAPKIELTGLRVVGKIELPSPKKKEEEKEEQTDEKVNQPSIKRERHSTNRNRQPKPPRKTLSIAEQRQREEKIKLRKKKEAEQRAKEKKRENYLKKVSTKTKSDAQKVTKPTIEKTTATKSKGETGILTKFFNWIRRE